MNARLNSASRTSPQQSLSDFAIKPLVLAISAALPLLATALAGTLAPTSARAQTAPRLPALRPTELPKPAAGWLVNGKAGDSAYNQAGGTPTNPVGTVTQNIPRAIYQWGSFDVGVNSTMTFSFKTPDGAALNRVVGSVAPSQILGRLNSTVADANGKAVTGGTVLLINQNGILFGPKSQVNTGALIASTLNVGNDDFLNGFDTSLKDKAPTFVYEGGPSLYADPKAFNFVRVEQGATIETTNGGQVFLFAQNVDNAGSIKTPGGQTVLAGGTDVFLNSPTNERIYASEVNPSLLASRGLLVEVNGASGRVGNTGSIDVPRGNATLVGMAVNQSGRISATTSVSENGSIFLLARSAVVPAGVDDRLFKRATAGGLLTLGANSKLEITPDATPDAKGVAATATATTPFTASRVELSGRQIELQTNASIVAPGGIVNARAESQPNYKVLDPTALTSSDFGEADPGARLTLGAGASVSVAGTAGAEVSAARNFVTTELLGANDLKDAPLQRDGPLYRSRITFDVRKAVPILGDTSSYVAGIARTAEEKMAAGGSVNFSAAGAVVLDGTSKVNVSGGKLTYTDAQVRPSTLISADGARFSLNDAPADVRYSAIVGNEKVLSDSWGRVTQFAATPSRLELGYVEGKDAGTFKVNSPIAVLGGALAAGAVIGERQQAGTDAVAKNGVLEFGARQTGSNPFGVLTSASGVLRDFSVTAQTRPMGADLLNASSDSALPDVGWVAASALNRSGAGTVRITSYGSVAVEDGANLVLPRKGSFEINAAGSGGVSLGGDITARGGSVTVRTVDFPSPAVPGGSVRLQAGRRVDVSGDFVNQSLDGARAGSAVAGGSVQLLSAHGLELQDGSAIDVSGGATVNIGGGVSGTNAGAITMESETGAALLDARSTVSASHIGANLKGVSLAGGGSLSLRAAEIDIREQLRLGPRPPVRDGFHAGSLVVDDDLFRQGGFTNFNIEGAQRLTVDPGVRIAPQASRWTNTPTTRLAATGSKLSDVLSESVLDEGQRNAASVRLASSGLVDGRASGDLTLGAGAVIQTDAGGNVTLTAGRALVLDVGSKVNAAGGKVSLGLERKKELVDTFLYEPKFEISAGAVVDVSGKTVLQPTANNFRQGRVFDGGSISLNVAAGGVNSPRLASIKIASSAILKADGASDVLDVNVRTNSGTVTRRTEVNSAGGAINVTASVGGARIAGNLSARSGGGTAAGGTLALSSAGSQSGSGDQINGLGAYSIALTDKPLTTTVPGVSTLGVLTIPAQTIANGQFADVTLASLDRIDFGGNPALTAARAITLNAPVLQTNPGAAVRISAPSSVTLGAQTASLISDTTPPPLRPNPSSLQIDSGLVTFNGTTELRQISNLDVRATDSVRFDAVRPNFGNARAAGSLSTTGNVTLTAPQTTVTTNTDFTVNAPNKTVSFKGGDATSATVLSAAGSLTVNAATIAQDGVVRVPFGRVALNATESVSLGASSLTSVSGDGMTVPYGSALGTAGWLYDGGAVAAPTEKLIALNAPGQAVAAQAGSKLGLAGGGSLVSQDFVAGPGGSKDVFTGALDGSFAVVPNIRNFAPSDANIARLSAAAAAGASSSAALPANGQQITIGADSQLPAGTYAVLPARYALLPGAFLITPSTNKVAVDAAYTVTRADGAQVVAGQRGSAGTNYRDALAVGYVVRTSEQAKQLSEVRSQSADTYFADRATFAGAAVARLPQDAGSLRVEANRLALDGSFDFARAAAPAIGRAPRGGEVDLAAKRIVVADASDAAAAAAVGTLVLTPAQINNTGATSVVLGGSRAAATSSSATSDATNNTRTLNVTATEVVIANTAQAISVADLVVAATDRVVVNPRGSIKATTDSSTAEALTTVGDGALLRASADAAASVTRTGVQLAKGELLLGAGANVAARGITAEATARTQIAADAGLESKAITLGAPRIALGSPLTVAGAPVLGGNTLLIGPVLGGQLAAAENLGLRSFSAIDIYGTTNLGSSSLKGLTLDTGSIAVWGNAAEFNAQAGGVRLANTSGASNGSSTLPTASARMVVKATGNGLTDATSAASTGSGELGFGPGTVALQGVADARFEASQAVVFENKTNLQASGQLTLAAPRVVAQGVADASVTAAGLLRVESFSNPSVAVNAKTFDSGASLTLKGARVEQAGTIALASGRLDITSTGNGANSGVEFASGSKTLLAGRSSVFDSIEVTTSGGDLKVDAGAGNIVIGNGLIDVSASGAEARAGSMSFVAKTGSVEIGGSLLARSVSQANTVGAVGANSALGGKLSIDSASAVNLAALANTLNREAEADTTRVNFASSLTLRNRVGNQTLNAGTVLRASTVDVSADAGSLNVAGKFDASGAQGGNINLAARDNLALTGDAELLAVAQDARGNGGQVRLTSRDGRISVGDRVTVDTTAVGASSLNALVPARNGTVTLSATRVGALAATAAGTEVQVDPLRGSFKGVDRIDVEAVKVYNYTGNVTVGGTATTALTTATIAAHNASFAGTNGTQANTILDRLAGDPVLRSLLHLRSGVEVRSPGDITVTGDTANSGWNLTPFAANGSVNRPGGEAMNLTLRAAGNLNVQASISDGFRAGGAAAPTTAATASRILPESTIVAGAGSDLRLVAGADLTAASRLATLASDTKGDVVIGRTSTDVIVRTTTGALDIAAGRDVKLLNAQAVAYTTGAPVAVSDLVGWVRPISTANRYAVVSGSTVQSTMLNGSGSVTVTAARDVVGVNAVLPQYGSNWWWRGESASDTGVVSWWSRYDKFKQGFGSLSGGDVIVSAGRDAVDVQAAAGSSGYIIPAKISAIGDVGASLPGPTVNRFGAGGVNINAERDVLGGVAIATGPRVDVAAGNSVRVGSAVGGSETNLQVLYGNSAVSIRSGRDLRVGRVTAQALITQTRQFNTNASPNDIRLGGLSQQASLRAVATAGALNYAGSGPFEQTSTVPSLDDAVPSNNDDLAKVIPSRTLLASPEGASSIAKTGGLIQLPALTASLSVLARDSLDIGIVTVAGISRVATTPGRGSVAEIIDPAASLFRGLKSTQPQADGAPPVRFVSAQGDVRIGGGTTAVKSAAPIRIRAGRDVEFLSGAVQAQQQSDADTSLVEAGRDVRFASGSSLTGFTLHGPGDMVVLTGRNVDLGTSSGFQFVGNRVNSALPSQSAHLTLVAGVAASDWRAAQSTYFHVLGGTGVAAKPGDLVAQLDANANGQSLPGASSAAAKAFDALTVSQRVDGARQRVGDAAFDTALLSLMRQTAKEGQALTLAEARTQFDKQTDAVKLSLVGKTLASTWAAKVAQPGQKLLVNELVTAAEKAAVEAAKADRNADPVAAAQAASYDSALRAYVKRRTGTEAVTLTDAITRFASLPLEQQLIFTDQVLTAEVRNAGRAAAALSGEERDRAYAKAYDAIDTVFPINALNAATTGNVLMGSSQVKTLQGSDIAMFTPRGGINVGELTAGGTADSTLGIVTSAGGGVSLVVRDNVEVNQSRVFTVGKGDLLMWSGQGNIDAGRGAKTVTGAPPPVITVEKGVVKIDNSGSFSGSGIAVLNADSTLDLYAPKGEINAGDAGIKSLGNAFLGASRFVGADNLAIGGVAVGAPPPASTGGVTAALASLSPSALASTQVNAEDSEEEKERKRRRRLALLLEFLGFGEAPAKP
jgi:filamentous hemagglutinin family protein